MTAPGTLFVVATPIGNLEDITLRALRILREVDLIAAEDTRRTGNLLRHYDIHTRLVSLHAHNEAGRVPGMLRRLKAGQSVALVSDAGTPAISDPGAVLVQAARRAALRVIPIPGPSAITTALSAAGLAETSFQFGGFPPSRSTDRKNWFGRVAARGDTAFVCFEAPHRLERTLRELGFVLVEQPIMVARELTKVHEEWLEGTPEQLLSQLGKPIGEYVIVIPPAPAPAPAGEQPDDALVWRLFGDLTNNTGMRRRDALRELARRTGLTVRQVYQAIERYKLWVDSPT